MLLAGPSPLGNPPPPLKIVGSRIVTAKGTDVMLKGINWFGFNVRDKPLQHSTSRAAAAKGVAALTAAAAAAMPAAGTDNSI
jgi:hypothetical protein